MKNQILIPVILGLHNSIFTVDAQQACQAIKNVMNSIEFQFTNPQRSTDPGYTNLKGGLQLRKETKEKGNRDLRIQTLLFLRLDDVTQCCGSGLALGWDSFYTLL